MNRIWTVTLVAVLAVVGVAVGVELFAPEQATRATAAEAAAVNGPNATVVTQGRFRGADAFHEVSGTVAVVEEDGVHYLVFRNYEQTQGPDVFVYLTPDPTPRTTADVNAGLKVRIDGGADGGESTKEGTFRQRLPDGFDPARYQGVAIWCEDFRVLFGSATLS